MGKGELARRVGKQGGTICVLEGVIWITGADVGDRVLHPGEEFSFTGNGLFLIQGLTEAKCKMSEL